MKTVTELAIKNARDELKKVNPEELTQGELHHLTTAQETIETLHHKVNE